MTAGEKAACDHGRVRRDNGRWLCVACDHDLTELVEAEADAEQEYERTHPYAVTHPTFGVVARYTDEEWRSVGPKRACWACHGAGVIKADGASVNCPECSAEPKETP